MVSQAVPRDGAEHCHLVPSPLLHGPRPPETRPAAWNRTVRACCPGWGGIHCTLGKHLGSAQIRGFLEAAGCLGREAGSRRNVSVRPILSFRPPQPLQRPSPRATALPPYYAAWRQVQ